MLKFHSTGEAGTYAAEIHFPNKLGAYILKRKTIGEPTVFEVSVLKDTNLIAQDLDNSSTIAVSECCVEEEIERIRTWKPD